MHKQGNVVQFHNATPFPLKAAILLAERFGWAVVPLHGLRPDGGCTCAKGPACNSAGKHPRLSEWTSEATDDASTITEWFRQWPTANVGVATGEASGFFVLDVDPDKGGDDSLAELVERHGPLPTTTQAVTGSGGAHYLFALPGFAVTNSSNKVGKGLDIRGDGGQIVVAPSRSAKGQYRWVRPPWEMPPAPAPAWLLATLGRAPERTGLATPDTRGYFPPASAAVLEEARAALAKHGPAVDGQGGGLHTVRAGMLLTHDYALTDDEAWPLLDEWNDTCDPPWESDELRAQALAKGRKYGKADYGCRRTLDAEGAARRLIQDWRAKAPGLPDAERDAAQDDMVQEVRRLVVLSGDPLRRERIERELQAATGASKSALALPRVRAEDDAVTDPPPGTRRIVGGGRAQSLADADEVLGAQPHVFQRNGALFMVRKLRDAKAPDADLVKRDPESLVLEEMGAEHVLNELATQTWVRKGKKPGEWLTTDYPTEYARGVVHAPSWMHVRPLTAIVGAPTLDADMNVIDTPGYHPASGLLLTTSTKFQPVPARPTKDDALDALRTLRAPFAEFPWVRRDKDPAHATAAESAHLAALLLAGVRHLVDTAPAAAYDAPRRGSGKSKLGDSIGLVWHGTVPPHATYAKGDDEFRKMIAACLLAGDPVIMVDNVDRPLRSPELCNALTTTRYSDRILGASNRAVLDARVLWIINGNNLVLMGDISRRVIVSTIDPQEERPEDRTFKIPNLTEHILANRHALVPAALTILRAFHLANPPQQVKPIGSFEQWSRLVREPLLWLGMPDPCDTTADANEVEPETLVLGTLLHTWREAYGAEPKTAPLVAGNAERFARPALAEAITNALGGEREVNPKSLGYYLRRWKDAVTQGMRFHQCGKDRSGYAQWAVQMKDDATGAWV